MDVAATAKLATLQVMQQGARPEDQLLHPALILRRGLGSNSLFARIKRDPNLDAPR